MNTKISRTINQVISTIILLSLLLGIASVTSAASENQTLNVWGRVNLKYGNYANIPQMPPGLTITLKSSESSLNGMKDPKFSETKKVSNVKIL